MLRNHKFWNDTQRYRASKLREKSVTVVFKSFGWVLCQGLWNFHPEVSATDHKSTCTFVEAQTWHNCRCRNYLLLVSVVLNSDTSLTLGLTLISLVNTLMAFLMSPFHSTRWYWTHIICMHATALTLQNPNTSRLCGNVNLPFHKQFEFILVSYWYAEMQTNFQLFSKHLGNIAFV